MFFMPMSSGKGHHCYREKANEDGEAELKGDERKEAEKNNEAVPLTFVFLSPILDAMASAGVAGPVQSSLPSSLGRWTDDSSLPDRAGDVGRPDGLLALDRRLVALCRQRGPLRAVLASIARQLVRLSGWERIGYARLSDYAMERLGLSARSVRSLAQIGEAFRVFPGLEEALAAGTLGWTKVRLLASLPAGEHGADWIARASRLTAADLSKSVRAVDRGSTESHWDDADDGICRSRVFQVRCSPDVRWKWHATRGAASRAAGRMLPVAEVAELIAAEVLSSLPVDEPGDQDACTQDDTSWSRPVDLLARAAAPEGIGSPWRGYGDLEALVVRLEHADAFELDDRFRRALSIERCLDARMGPLLARLRPLGPPRAGLPDS
jgi:hypothetical protein